MQQLNFSVIKLTFCLVLGILIGYKLDFPINLSIGLTLSFLIVLFISFLINRTTRKKTIIFGIFSILVFSSLGILTTTFHKQENQLNHYTNQNEIDLNSTASVTFKVREILKPGIFYNKYIVDLKYINQKKVSGKSLLNVQKDSTKTPLKVDQIILTKSKLKELNSPLNPNQFDYRSYLKKQHIYHQLFVNNKGLKILERKPSSAFGLAARIREHINLKLKGFDFTHDELAIINALLLGQRQDISKETYDSYTQAGAIHILAISGLHVGLVLLILNFMFKPLDRLKHGKKIKIGVILLLLWCFAIIAGLSASVTRAVTMFSVVAIGMNLKRPTNIYNTLAISIFVLLLFKPMFLFDVGFQLSYLAVFSIVWIQPLLYKLWNPKIWLIDKFWQIFTVTVAAQFGVAPISLFYFHQFPGLFFVSNLVIIPLLGFILGFGFVLIALAVLNILPPFLASVFGDLISLMNAFVSFISKQEIFLFKQISFNILSVFASYILIICLIKLYQKYNYKRIILGLSSITIFLFVSLLNKYQSATNEFIVFHKNRYSLLGLKNNVGLNIYHNMDSLTLKNDRVVANYKIGNHVKSVKIDNLQSVYELNDKLLLVVDSLAIYKTSFDPDIILLRNSPKINLNRLIDMLNPELVIADGSNYKSYQERWAKTCLKKQLPFHQTSKKGAYIIKGE